MMAYWQHVGLHAAQQLRRHLRSPAIWALAIAGPVAARYLVPEPGSTYSVIGVNDAILRPSASVIGLQLGVLTAVMLAPLAYIFLKAGPTRIQPRQVTDVAPRARTALSLGRWLGDTAAIWGLLLLLAFAGVILSLFRLPLDEVAPFETIAAATFIAMPALALIAAVRTLFSMRPVLRRGWGDFTFFMLWLVAIILSASFFMDGSGGSPLGDIFGFAAPLVTGTNEPVTAMYIGSGPSTGRIMDFHAMAGVTDPAYLLSRVFWLVTAGVLAWGSGFLFQAGRVKAQRGVSKTSKGPATFSSTAVLPVQTSPSGFVGRGLAFARELFRPWLVLALIGVIALSGFVLPLRGMVGPALGLALIFPLTRYGSRWRPKSIEQWMASLPMSAAAMFTHRLIIACAVSLILLLPSLVGIGPGEWKDVLAIGVGVPVIAVTLGHVTRGPVAARLILLILWYGYLNIGGPPVLG
jgi:hypothetical protein